MVLLLGQLGRCSACDSGSTSHSGSFDGATLGRESWSPSMQGLQSGSDTIGGVQALQCPNDTIWQVDCSQSNGSQRTMNGLPRLAARSIQQRLGTSRQVTEWTWSLCGIADKPIVPSSPASHLCSRCSFNDSDFLFPCPNAPAGVATQSILLITAQYSRGQGAGKKSAPARVC